MKKELVVALTVMLTLSTGLVAEAGFNLGNVIGKVVKEKNPATSESQQRSQAERMTTFLGQCDLGEGDVWVLEPQVLVEYNPSQKMIVLVHNTTYEQTNTNAVVHYVGPVNNDGRIGLNLTSHGQYTHGFLWKEGADHFFTFVVPPKGGSLDLVRHAGVTVKFSNSYKG